MAGNGILTLVDEVPTGILPGSVAVHPWGRFVYVAHGGVPFLKNGNVSAYRIGNNGGLTPVLGSPFPAGVGPIAVVVDPWGRFVYVANLGTEDIKTENISGYRVEANGVLKPLLGSPFPDGQEPQGAAVDPFGRVLYVPNFFGKLSGYSIGSDGALTQVPGSPFAAPPSLSVVVDPWGRFVYLGRVNVSPTKLWAYRIGANGALTPLQNSPFEMGFSPGSMVVDIFGRFLYLANGTGVSAYLITGNGTLTLISGSPFATGFSPTAMAVSF